MSRVETTEAGRKGPLRGIRWNLSTPNTVAVIGLAAVILLIALRQGFRPINLA